MDCTWKDNPSRIVYAPAIMLAFLLMSGAIALSIFFNLVPFVALAALFALYLLFKICGKPSPTYMIKDGQLIVEEGTIRKKHEYIELFRVRDISSSSNLFFNCIKIGKINLITTDSTSPKLEIKYIKNYKKVADLIRKEVLKAKKENNIQEIEIG